MGDCFKLKVAKRKSNQKENYTIISFITLLWKCYYTALRAGRKLPCQRYRKKQYQSSFRVTIFYRFYKALTISVYLFPGKV